MVLVVVVACYCVNCVYKYNEYIYKCGWQLHVNKTTTGENTTEKISHAFNNR